MYKTRRETIKEVFNLNYKKFLVIIKKKEGFNIRKDIIFVYYD